jgi:hypothetical protein
MEQRIHAGDSGFDLLKEPASRHASTRCQGGDRRKRRWLGLSYPPLNVRLRDGVRRKIPDLIILLKEERATEWDTNHGRHYH